MTQTDVGVAAVNKQTVVLPVEYTGGIRPLRAYIAVSPETKFDRVGKSNGKRAR